MSERKRFRVSTELRRTAQRPGTRLAAFGTVALPLLLALGVATGSGQPAFDAQLITESAGSSAANFAIFVLLVASQLFLALVVAVVVGESTSREASQGHMAFLAVLPVPRAQLLAVKFASGAVCAATVVVVLTVVSVAAGTVAFGWGPLVPSAGPSVPSGQVPLRLLGVVVYLAVYSLWIVALALTASVLSKNNSVVAVGGTVVVTLLFHLLGGIPGMGSSRGLYPTRNYDAWMALTRYDIDVTAMQWGGFVSLLCAAVFMTVGFIRFALVDIEPS